MRRIKDLRGCLLLLTMVAMGVPTLGDVQVNNVAGGSEPGFQDEATVVHFSWWNGFEDEGRTLVAWNDQTPPHPIRGTNRVRVGLGLSLGNGAPWLKPAL